MERVRYTARAINKIGIDRFTQAMDERRMKRNETLKGKLVSFLLYPTENQVLSVKRARTKLNEYG
jgi:hypothetical protein